MLYKAAGPEAPRRRSSSALGVHGCLEGCGYPHHLGTQSRSAPRLPPAPQPPELEGSAMRSPCAVARALVLAGLWLASAAAPLALSDAGPHVHYGWGEAIRLRHLYTAGPHGPSSCFLRIREDGVVDCARGQSAHSECPPRPSPAQRPFFPLSSSAPAGLPIPRSPGLGTSEFALPGSPDGARRWERMKRVRGPTAPCYSPFTPSLPPSRLWRAPHSWEP